LGRRKLAAGDESDQRGDTVHVDTIVKRRQPSAGSIAEAGLRSIPIVRAWKFFTLVRRHSTSLGDTRPNILIAPLVTVRFEDRRIAHSPTQQPPAMPPPSFICSNGSLRCDERPAGDDVDHAASSWTPVSSISGIAPPTLMNTSTYPLSMTTSTRSALASVSNHLVAEYWIALSTDTDAGPHLWCR
jgi:hypothetical protein